PLICIRHCNHFSRPQRVTQSAANAEGVSPAAERSARRTKFLAQKYARATNMSIQEINEAVRKCVRDALGQHDPLKALQNCLDALKAKGWRLGDVDMVRN